jgi:selenocysteine lyase/cysteine desulfurase
MPISLRDEFKIFEKCTFLDWAATSPAPLKSVQKIKEFLDSKVYLSEEDLPLQPVKMDTEAGPLRQEVAKLLNASEKEIAIAGTSTSQGIQIALESINPKRGENIITSDLEDTSVGTALQKWRKKGVEVKILKNRHGDFNLEDFQSLINNKTKVVVLSSVTYVNGYKFDIEELSKIAHESGAYLVLDSIQQLGAIKLNTKKAKIDFIAAGGFKWLTSPFGIGILYVNEELLDVLEPPFYGYRSVVEPLSGWEDFFRDPNNTPIIDYEYVKEAKKFEYGGYPPNLGIVGLTASVSLINAFGIENIEKKILKLKKILIEELEKIGARVLSPDDEKNFSAITTFNINKTLNEDYKLLDLLNSNGIKVSGRGCSGVGGIRVAIHYPNEENDIIRFIEQIKKFR